MSWPGYYTDYRIDAEDVVRSAGREFTADVAVRADENAIEGWHRLFRACTTISSLRYEKAEGTGRIIIASKNHPATQSRIAFAGGPKLGEFRGARKILELSARGSALHSDSQIVFGLVDVGAYNRQEENLFEIKFLGHHHWELAHAGSTLMRVRYGLPYLPKPSAYEGKLPKDLPRLFSEISEDDIELLVSLVREAEKEAHGTLLVVTPSALEEASRLRAQATLINPLRLTPELLSNLTPIDGAVLIDPQGYCHAIGVILDGQASGFGDPSRGARYNSALRYVASSSSPCLAIVVSEDGGIDLIPDLRPRICRSLIDKALEELDESFALRGYRGEYTTPCLSGSMSINSIYARRTAFGLMAQLRPLMKG